jgi:hypothetical protein
MLYEGGQWLPEVRMHILNKLQKTADGWLQNITNVKQSHHGPIDAKEG